MFEEQEPAAHLLDLSGVKKTDMLTVGVTSQSVALTRLCFPAGTAETCSVPAAATRRSQCQASSCLSPAVSARPATVASS